MSFSRVCAALALVLGAALIVPAPGACAGGTGTLLGNVTDSSGAAVPGATVVPRKRGPTSAAARRPTKPATTSSRACRTAPTRWKPSCRASRRWSRQNVKVDVNTTIRVDLKLEVGQMTEAVTVSAETPVLQTDRTDTGRIIESKMVSRNAADIQPQLPEPARSRCRASTRPHREHSQFFNSQDSLSTRGQRPAAAWRTTR